MFKGWFSRKPASTTSVFTANWEMSPQDPETFADDLALHAVDAKDLPAVHLALEIRLDAADRIVGVRTWQEGTLRSDQPSYVTERWKPLIGSPFPTPVQTREPKWLVLDEDGPHVLGGPIPDGLHVPRTENPGGLQFVATINPDDNLRSAGEHPLHILCPLLLPNFARLDLDYSDPMAPRIVDEASFHADISLEGLDFEGITDASAITYEGARVGVASATGDPDLDRAGLAGVPFWVQAPKLPRCPISGHIMEFVAQISSAPDLTVVGNPFASAPSYFDRLRTLDFWGGGTLFVFHAPANKIVSVFIQNN
jgi:hypothetical protein